MHTRGDAPVKIAVIGCGYGRNLFDVADMAKRGFTCISMGRPAAEQFTKVLRVARRA